ncbi:immunoglobulin E-set superfamily protein [Wolffia australiana]
MATHSGLPPSAVLAAACFLLILGVASATSVHYCDKHANYAVKVNGVDISPNPVVSGRTAKFGISAVTESPVEGGKLVIDVKYFGFHVHQETRDLCEETSCPVAVGDFVIAHEQVLPFYTPPGSYTLTLKLLSANGSQLTCVSFDFSVSFGLEVADE